MSDIHQKPVPVVCRSLRTKEAFVETNEGDAPWQAGLSTTAVYWCLRTMETAGPDGCEARPSCCGAARVCYRPTDQEA